MDDEEWVIEDPSESQPEVPEEVPVEAPAEEAAPEAEPEPEEIVKGKNIILVYKHWVRPKFLQYNYMYDYRRNYYDDVIAYMDRRNRGVLTEPPRAQTWGERALRTYLAKNSSYGRTVRSDSQLLHHISSGARFHRYHSKSLISRKYSMLGFNTVSVPPPMPAN